MRVNFDGISGKIKSIDMNNGLGEVEFSQEFHFYIGYSGGHQSSGAYIFRPTQNNSEPLAYRVETTRIDVSVEVA